MAAVCYTIKKLAAIRFNVKKSLKCITPDTGSQITREPRADLSRDNREFKPLNLGRGADQNTGEFAWSVFQLAATQLLQNIRGGLYTVETLEDMGRMTDEIKREIATVQGGITTLRVTIRGREARAAGRNVHGH